MSLFINEKHHKNIYKNNNKIITTNPRVFRSDPVIELIEEHQKANDSIYKILRNLEKRGDQQDIQCDRLDLEIKKNKKNHGEDTEHIRHKLVDIEGAIQKLAQRLDIQEVTEEMLMDQINTIYNENNKIIEKVDRQELMEKQIFDQFLTQTKNHELVLKRLDSQEEISDKNFIQMDRFRLIELKRHADELEELCRVHAKLEQQLAEVDETKLFMQKAYNDIQKQLHQFALKTEEILSNADEQFLEHKRIHEQYLEQVRKYTHSGKQLENRELATTSITKYSSRTSLAEINRGKELDIKEISCSINKQQEVKRNLKPLIRKKTFGNIKQNKTRVLNKKFSKHPKIDDF